MKIMSLRSTRARHGGVAAARGPSSRPAGILRRERASRPQARPSRQPESLRRTCPPPRGKKKKKNRPKLTCLKFVVIALSFGHVTRRRDAPEAGDMGAATTTSAGRGRPERGARGGHARFRSSIDHAPSRARHQSATIRGGAERTPTSHSAICLRLLQAVRRISALHTR